MRQSRFAPGCDARRAVVAGHRRGERAGTPRRRRRVEQAAQRREGTLLGVAFEPQDACHAETLESLAVVELVAEERADQLRHPGAERLGGGAHAAMLDHRRGARFCSSVSMPWAITPRWPATA